MVGGGGGGLVGVVPTGKKQIFHVNCIAAYHNYLKLNCQFRSLMKGFDCLKYSISAGTIS